MSEEKVVTVMNRGSNPMVLKGNKQLHPGEVAEVSASEAKHLLSYGHVVDMAKVNPGQARLEAENQALKEKLAKKDGKAKKADAPVAKKEVAAA